jgi:hypothetical protein
MKRNANSSQCSALLGAIDATSTEDLLRIVGTDRPRSLQ